MRHTGPLWILLLVLAQPGRALTINYSVNIPSRDELFDFVSTSGSSGVIHFPGTNYDGSSGLDGPQGGLLDDAAARGGAGVVDRSIVFTIIVDADPGTGGNQGLFRSPANGLPRPSSDELPDHVQLAR